MRYTLNAELTKLRTMPSTVWLLVTAAMFTIAIGAMATGFADVKHCPTPATCFEDTTKLSLTGARLGQVAIVVLAVLAMSNEYGTRMISTTLMAMPRRTMVLAGKLVVVTASTLLAGSIGVLGALLIGRNILPGNGFHTANGYPPLSLADGPTLRAAAGTVLYLALIAVLSLGVATIVRDTAGAITTVLVVLFLSPMVATFVSNPVWQHRLRKYSPMDAGLAIQATRDLTALPVAPWTGLGVLAAYAAAAVVIGALVLRLRDA